MGAQDRISLGRDPSGRHIIVNRRGEAALHEVEYRLGFNLTIVQGGYQNGGGASASAGVHDGGTVLDFRVWDLPDAASPQGVVKVLREVGFAAWYRTEAQGFSPHIHAVLIGDPDLVASAQEQVVAYRNGKNGLKGNGADDGPDVPFTIYHYDEADDMTPTERKQLAEAHARATWSQEQVRKLWDSNRALHEALKKLAGQ